MTASKIERYHRSMNADVSFGCGQAILPIVIAASLLACERLPDGASRRREGFPPMCAVAIQPLPWRALFAVPAQARRVGGDAFLKLRDVSIGLGEVIVFVDHAGGSYQTKSVREAANWPLAACIAL
jgi:hypothetical protein